MLVAVTSTNIRLLNLGARDHAALHGQDASSSRSVFEAADHTCHVCGVRTVDGLEIDNTAGHAPRKTKGWRAICQFCHNLKHPLWSAARGRIVAIWAPDISQVDLHRLAWSIVTWREAHPEKAEILRADLVARAQRFAETFDCASAEALFEAAFATRDTLGAGRSKAVLLQVDQVLRFVPSEILLDPQQVGDMTIDQGSRLSTWSIGGFRKIARMAGRDMLADHDPAALEVAATAVKEEAGA